MNARKSVACSLLLVLLLITWQSNGQDIAQPYLDAYAHLVDKTILHGDLPKLPDSLLGQFNGTTNAGTAALKTELSRLGFNLVPDGEKFVQILPAAEGTNPRVVPAFHYPATATDGNAANKTINFPNIDLGTFLDVYGSLAGRTVLQSPILPLVRLSYCTASPLTQEEVLHGATVVLSLHGVAVIKDGPELIWIVPASEVGKIHPNAPKREAGAELIDPTKVPKTGVDNIPRARPPAIPRPPGGAMPASPQGSNLDDLIAYYGNLAGRAYQPSSQYSGRQIYFEARTPLTKAEILYAIDSVLGLNDLAVVPVDEHTITLGVLPGKRPSH